MLGDPPPDDGSLGMLLRDTGPEALARAIAAVLAVPADRARVRAHAQRFSWDEPVALLASTLRAARGTRAA
jgi:hypothetical protein